MTDTAPARAGARTVKVPEDRDGQRLDNFLLGQLKGAPRSLVYKLVRSGQVRVNGGRAKAERKLEAGDEVRIPPLRLETEADRGTPAPGLLQRIESAIVFEDARLLALDKPSGVASHGGSGISFGAIETLRALRPGQTLELAHRLDRDTSGVLVVAKKRSALTQLQALLREDHGAGIRKRYLTLLAGRMPDGLLIASRRASSNTMLASIAASRPFGGTPPSPGASSRTGGIRTSSPASSLRSALARPPFTRTCPLRTIL